MDDKMDIDGDGKITASELNIYEQKLNNQERMAWVALAAIVLTGGYLMLFATDARLEAASKGVLDMYFLILGTVVAAYMGASTFMSKK